MKTKMITAVAVLLALVAGAYLFAPKGAEPTAQAPVDPEGTALVTVQLPVELSQAAQMGKRAFEAKCAACHGANAAGQKGVAPPLVHKIYEPSHHGDMAFMLAAQNGVRAHHWPFGDMPPVAGLTQANMKQIIQYIRELQRENGIT